MLKKVEKDLHTSLVQITLSEFMSSYNQNMPATFPRASTILLLKFKELHPALFKHGDLWTLDQHRKKVFEWLPSNSKTA